MLGGDFSAVTIGAPNGILYDPQPGGMGPYLPLASRPTFLSEYGCNCIPAFTPVRLRPQDAGSACSPFRQTVTAMPALLNSGMLTIIFGTGTLDIIATLRTTRIDLHPDRKHDSVRQIQHRAILRSPIRRILGAAGGGTFDGGQPGAASGRIQNVGLGASHVITPTWFSTLTSAIRGRSPALSPQSTCRSATSA